MSDPITNEQRLLWAIFGHPDEQPNVDETRADAADEWARDLAMSGDTDFNTQNTEEA